MTRVLVTGATGFIGRALIPRLLAGGYAVTAASRAATTGLPGAARSVVVGELGPDTDWTEALAGAGAVVHLAARVHVMAETATDPLAEFRRANADGTRRLAEQAAAAGVKRFVYLSSIKVNGETTPGAPFTEADTPEPRDSYGMSKWEAEQALAAVAAATALEPVVLRPPLVYGPGVKGNFLSLLRAVAKGWPLPLGCAANRRSLLYVGNLADAVAACLAHPAAAGRTFLISDGEAPAVAGLHRALALSLNRPIRSLPVPPALLRLAGTVAGKSAAVGRLLDSLVIDDRQLRQTLDWTPPYRLADGLVETARWFKDAADGNKTRTDTP